jgi:AraC-like DNA-binding protein
MWRPSQPAGLELRRGCAVRAPVARHWHDDYQLCLVEDGGGELRYRGVSHPTPSGSLFALAPGEVHANVAAPEGCSFRSMYLAPELVSGAAAELGIRGPLDLPRPMIEDEGFAGLYRRVHLAMEGSAARLEQDSGLLHLLAALVRRHGAERGGAPRGRESGAVGRAREYLHAHFQEPVALADLARVAGLSRYHLSRAFREELGLPPHAYQTHLRVLHARRLIEAGRPLATAAAMAGFADQSHLARHFRRMVALPPGACRPRKNVQDTAAGAR